MSSPLPRIYSPTLGRFLQTDPIGYEDQFNLYAYVGNDPVNGVDFTGLCDSMNNECPDEEPYLDSDLDGKITENGITITLSYSVWGEKIELEGTATSDFGLEGRAEGNLGEITIKAQGSLRPSNEMRAKAEGTVSSDGGRTEVALGKAELQAEVGGITEQALRIKRAAVAAEGELGILTGIAFAAERIGDAAKAIRSLFKKRDE